jgi:hypothetical protein
MPSVGRTVKLRDDIGFANDLRNLDRLRTALRTSRKLDRNAVARVVVQLDAFTEGLIELHRELTEPPQALRAGKRSSP